MTNPILLGDRLWTEVYRGFDLEAYKTSIGGAIRVISYGNRLEFITYSETCAFALAEAKARIDNELEGTYDDIPF